jgi:hypothetical protein
MKRIAIVSATVLVTIGAAFVAGYWPQRRQAAQRRSSITLTSFETPRCN